ncbi:MAG: Lipase/Acylhydrolase with GDSL-like motif [Candidatus Carbobacillus altaicus]|uniref:Lipase/Acylhydrolase with GDSL-like motif n=1 Tax=Candidatus Carbonibacillus altaicus TaxID=2163959 RepID=A0A2R6XYH2_9BACL|nr:MAG: Lipase/Acylhydrolase with GDSL-like motif [Candidatus Carbobacillus altaicus]
MMRYGTRRVLLTIGIIFSVLALFLFVGGFVLALGTIFGPGGEAQAVGQSDMAHVGEPPDAQGKNTLTANDHPWPAVIVALGDSLARGIGDDGSGGFVGRLRKLMETSEKHVPAVTNLAVSGATSKDLLQKLSEPGVPETIRKADLLLLSIGGNDAFPDVRVLEQGDAGRENQIEANLTRSAELDRYRTHLSQALETIRSYNASAPIFLLGLYDPFNDVPGLGRASLQAVHAWNGAIEEVAADIEQVYVVPTFDLMLLGGRAYLSNDHFHPDARGYAAIAERLFSNIKEYASLYHPDEKR